MSCGWIPGPVIRTTFNIVRRGYVPWTVLMRRTCSRSLQGTLTLIKRTNSRNVRCVNIFSSSAKLSGGPSRFASAPMHVQTVNFVDTRVWWSTTISTEDRGSIVPSADPPSGNREGDSGKRAKSFHMCSMNNVGNAYSSTVNSRKTPPNGGHDAPFGGDPRLRRVAKLFSELNG